MLKHKPAKCLRCGVSFLGGCNVYFQDGVYCYIITRSDPRYHTSLGYAIMQIAKSVPNGMLVFFPSYHIMKMIIETWTVSVAHT